MLLIVVANLSERSDIALPWGRVGRGVLGPRPNGLGAAYLIRPKA